MEKAEKPTAAFILSLIGGIFVLIGGLLVIVVRTFIFGSMGIIGRIVGIYGLLGVIWGILIIVSAFMLNSKPEQHMTWSILVLVFSLLSWFGAAGGLLIGFLLGLAGGILGIVWKPTVMQPIPTSPPVTRVCPNCGTVIGTDVKFCPHCGKELP
jgi:hypothetical protein